MLADDRDRDRGRGATGSDRSGNGSDTGIPPQLRNHMERTFDADFSGVRLHRDSAHADELGVRAYTRGEEIHLASGQFQPETESGRALLGHELAHVLQQRQGRVDVTGQARGQDFNDDHGLESEAETLGRRAARGEPARIGGGAGPGATAGALPLQASGIELLKAKDPEPHDTSPVPDWPTLKARAAKPSAVDVHHILLTYRLLSHGWSSGLGHAQQALANKFAASKNVPDTVVEFGTTVRWGNWQRGTRMTARMLTMKGPAGSDATTGTYARLGSAVEGHLLNAHLHGPASFENLAPFSRSLNSTHSAVVEGPLKRMVYNQNRFFTYEVIVKDGTSMEDDGFFPSGIQCRVVEVNADGTHKPDGYQQNVEISQSGKVTLIGPNDPGTAAAPGRTVSFGAKLRLTEPERRLAELWQSLVAPWRGSYGAVVAEVLETAYRAVRQYQIRELGKSGSALLALPRTKVSFSTDTIRNSKIGRTEEIGTKMVARPLTLRPPENGQIGSVPASPWGGIVAGHLLNHHLHGPGDRHNLVPMTESLNRRFEDDVESKVKRLVLTEGMVVSYEVEMGGGRFNQAGLEDIPEMLTYSVTEYRPEANTTRRDREDFGNWTRYREHLSGSLLNNSGRQEDEDYQPPGKRRRKR